MKINKIFFITLLVNLSISILSFVAIATKINRVNTNELSTDRLQFTSHLYVSITNDNFFYSNSKLDNYIAYHKIHDSNVLIVRYSQMDCRSCIDFITSKISFFFPNYNNTPQIVFMVSDVTSGHAPNLNNIIILDKNEHPNIPADEFRSPYLMIYQHGVIKHLFIPSTDNPDVFETYIQSIKSRYFQT
ncbi:MAG: hypothetical protein CVU12_00465 [Bacteroidetes bacterium HGW-Bacteroidetes-7]|nr:MAG: hypothetical protein CVU12_00465 [Bacteroidetes bacterium HGW-Bacteroidetes-7]